MWHCLADRNAEYHPDLYEVREVSNDVAAVKISDVVRLPDADTLVTVWLTVKLFYEWSDDGRKRIICVWNAMVETEGSLDIRLQERGWNVLRSLTYTASCVDPNCAMSFTQTCMRVSPLGHAEFSASDVAVGTLEKCSCGVLPSHCHRHAPRAGEATARRGYSTAAGLKRKCLGYAVTIIKHRIVVGPMGRLAFAVQTLHSVYQHQTQDGEDGGRPFVVLGIYVQ